MLVMSSTVSTSNGIGAKSQKDVGLGCSPSRSPVKNNLPVTLVDAYANYEIEFTDVKVLLFVLLVILFKCK